MPAFGSNDFSPFQTSNRLFQSSCCFAGIHLLSRYILRPKCFRQLWIWVDSFDLPSCRLVLKRGIQDENLCLVSFWDSLWAVFRFEEWLTLGEYEKFALEREDDHLCGGNFSYAGVVLIQDRPFSWSCNCNQKVTVVLTVFVSHCRTFVTARVELRMRVVSFKTSCSRSHLSWELGLKLSHFFVSEWREGRFALWSRPLKAKALVSFIFVSF